MCEQLVKLLLVVRHSCVICESVKLPTSSDDEEGMVGRDGEKWTEVSVLFAEVLCGSPLLARLLSLC